MENKKGEDDLFDRLNVSNLINKKINKNLNLIINNEPLNEHCWVIS